MWVSPCPGLFSIYNHQTLLKDPSLVLRCMWLFPLWEDYFALQMHTSHFQFIGRFPSNYSKAPILVSEVVFQLYDHLIWWAAHPALWFSLVLCRSLFLSLVLTDYLSYILCTQIWKPQQSWLHRKCCNVCVLKAPYLRDQRACLLASLSTAPLHHTACLFVLKQTRVSPLASKKYYVWHWTSKCSEVDGINREDKVGCLAFPSVIQDWQAWPTRGWEFSVPVKSCLLLLWWSDRPPPQKKESAVRWIDLRSVPNDECVATGGQARAKIHIAGATHFHQSIRRLKTKSQPTTHTLRKKEPLLSNDFIEGLKFVKWSLRSFAIKVHWAICF